MNSIKLVLRSELFIIFCLICLGVLIGVMTTLYRWYQTPPGTQFSLAFNYYPDYYHYISWMRDGQNGYWSITTRFTSESFPRKIAYPLYPALGHVGAWTGINIFYMYFLARIFLAALQLVIIYYLIRLVIRNPGQRILTFILTIFLPSFLDVGLTGGRIRAGFFLSGITNFDVYHRLAFIPHHILAHICVMGYFILLYKGLTNDNKVFSVGAGILLLVGSILNPATLIYMAFVSVLAFVLVWWTSFRGREKAVVSHFVLANVFGLLALVYYKFYLFTSYPWNILDNDPKASGHFTALVNNHWSVLQYLGALGVALPLALLTIVFQRREKNILYLLLVSWGMGPIIGFLFFRIFYNSYIVIFRLFQAQQFVPLGILAGLSVYPLLVKFNLKARLLALAVLATALVPYYYVSLKAQLAEVTAANYNIYLPLQTIGAFDYLNIHSPRDSVVLAGYYISELLPAYTNNRVYKGTSDLTYDWDTKLSKFTKFFNNGMTDAEALDFYKSGNISYILFGPDTPSPGALIEALGPTKLVYQNGSSYIYEIKK